MDLEPFSCINAGSISQASDHLRLDKWEQFLILWVIMRSLPLRFLWKGQNFKASIGACLLLKDQGVATSGICVNFPIFASGGNSFVWHWNSSMHNDGAISQSEVYN